MSKEFVAVDGIQDSDLKRIAKEMERKLRKRKGKKEKFNPDFPNHKTEPYKRERFDSRDYRGK